MKAFLTILSIVSISFTAYAADNVVGSLSCSQDRGIEICQDSMTSRPMQYSVRFIKEGKTIQLLCEKDSSEPANYSIRIVAGKNEVTISSSETYTYVSVSGHAQSTSTRPKQTFDQYRIFCDDGIIATQLQGYMTGNLYRDVQNADQSRIGFFFSRFDSNDIW